MENSAPQEKEYRKREPSMEYSTLLTSGSQKINDKHWVAIKASSSFQEEEYSTGFFRGQKTASQYKSGVPMSDLKQSEIVKASLTNEADKENGLPFDFMNLSARRQTPTFKDDHLGAYLKAPVSTHDHRRRDRSIGRLSRPKTPELVLDRADLRELSNLNHLANGRDKNQDRASQRNFDIHMASILNKIENQQKVRRENYSTKEGSRPPTPVRNVLETSKVGSKRLESRSNRSFVQYYRENSRTTSFILEDD